MRGRLTAVWRRAATSDGYSLTEMVVVLAILLIVVTALTQLFVSGSKAEVDMSNRVQAQQNARLALDKLRREIHCAKSVTWSGAMPTSSITITLGAYCPTNTTGAETTFTWCTKDKVGGTPPGAGAPYTLWRYSGSSCSGTGQKWADYLAVTDGKAFASYTPPGGGLLGTLRVQLLVDLTPGDSKPAIQPDRRHRPAEHAAVTNAGRTPQGVSPDDR